VHHPRQYSIASPRDGERPGYDNLSLTFKRVLEDHEGNPVRGVASKSCGFRAMHKGKGWCARSSGSSRTRTAS
jgi:sulfite reductase alpha subunit-like flavoprotein